MGMHNCGSFRYAGETMGLTVLTAVLIVSELLYSE